MVNKLVLATQNPGKLRELSALLAETPWEVQALPADAPAVEEHGLTFVENAILKARSAAALMGCAAIADDSGIEVDALNGAPGVHSARYAGYHGDDAANVRCLLTALEGVAPGARSARFRCVMVYLRHAHDPAPLIAQGVWEGFISTAPLGSGGFGYDPVFALHLDGPTAAQLSPEQKNTLSHRAKALQALVAQLQAQAQ